MVPEPVPAVPAIPDAITQADLAEALDSFWLFVACAGQRVHGQIADPDEVASVLLATLGRIVAERSPDEPAESPQEPSAVPVAGDPGKGVAEADAKPQERTSPSWRERALAAEAKLAEVEALPLLYLGAVAEGNAVVSYPAILAIISSEEEAPNGC